VRLPALVAASSSKTRIWPVFALRSLSESVGFRKSEGGSGTIAAAASARSPRLPSSGISRSSRKDGISPRLKICTQVCTRTICERTHARTRGYPCECAHGIARTHTCSGTTTRKKAKYTFTTHEILSNQTRPDFHRSKPPTRKPLDSCTSSVRRHKVMILATPRRRTQNVVIDPSPDVKKSNSPLAVTCLKRLQQQHKILS
jgi:hypothetical protein